MPAQVPGLTDVVRVVARGAGVMGVGHGVAAARLLRIKRSGTDMLR